MSPTPSEPVAPVKGPPGAVPNEARAEPRSVTGQTSSAVVLSAEQSVGDLLQQYGIAVDHGLSDDQVLSRRARCGPNAVTSHRARLLPVLWNQVRSPLLGLLLIAAAASFVVGERGAAVIIAVIVGYRSGWGS